MQRSPEGTFTPSKTSLYLPLPTCACVRVCCVGQGANNQRARGGIAWAGGCVAGRVGGRGGSQARTPHTARRGAHTRSSSSSSSGSSMRPHTLRTTSYLSWSLCGGEEEERRASREGVGAGSARAESRPRPPPAPAVSHATQHTHTPARSPPLDRKVLIVPVVLGVVDVDVCGRGKQRVGEKRAGGRERRQRFPPPRACPRPQPATRSTLPTPPCAPAYTRAMLLMSGSSERYALV